MAFGPIRTRDLASGTIQGFELSVHYYEDLGLVRIARYVAANVILWPQFDVLFANPAELASLTAQQRAWISQAARQASAHSVSLAANQNSSAMSKACATGARFASATPADLAALHRAFSPVYRKLEADPQTRAFIRHILALKRATPHGPASAGCVGRQ